MTKLTIEEANDILDRGGIISCPGYTYIGREYYLAYGTFPGCIRGGNIHLKPNDTKGWRQINLRELVENIGFYPDPYTMRTAMILECKDRSVDFETMIMYCINSDYTTNQLKNPYTSAVIWQRYFQSLENQDK